jgi:hypothetical protein
LGERESESDCWAERRLIVIVDSFGQQSEAEVLLRASCPSETFWQGLASKLTALLSIAD